MLSTETVPVILMIAYNTMQLCSSYLFCGKLRRARGYGFSLFSSDGGDCLDSDGWPYSYIRAPASIFDSKIDCLNYCGQVDHSDLVGVSQVTRVGWCGCHSLGEFLTT